MNRWAMVTVGVLSILMLLVGVFIGRGTKKVGSVQLSEHSPEGSNFKRHGTKFLSRLKGQN